MSHDVPINEPHPECIACQKPIEECTWLYYGGEMKETPPDSKVKHTIQIYWCHDCFETKVYPKLVKEK